MKRQFWLVGIVLLAVLSACRSKSDGPTDTYSSGVISIAADESFEPIIQEEIDVFESLYPLAGIVPRYTTEVEAINLLLKDSVRLAIATRTLTEEEMNSFLCYPIGTDIAPIHVGLPCLRTKARGWSL